MAKLLPYSALLSCSGIMLLYHALSTCDGNGHDSASTRRARRLPPTAPIPSEKGKDASARATLLLI